MNINNNIRKQLSTTQHYSISKELIDDLNIKIFKDKEIIEPFVGDGDLLKLLNLNYKNIKTYDIIYKNNIPNFTQMDTLLNNVLKSDKYVITNPPYLAKNKMSKELKERYKHLINNEINDLYQIFINQMIQKPIKGGLIIIPINFLIGKESEKIRNKFLNIYNIIHVNIFEKKMFEYTSQSVITLLFMNKYENANQLQNQNMNMNVNQNMNINDNQLNQNQNMNINDNQLNQNQNMNQNQYSINLYLPLQTIKNINSDILNLTIQNYFKPINDIQFKRYYNIPNNYKPTHIKINLIDPNNNTYALAEYSNEIIEHKISDRTFIYICIPDNIKFDDELERIVIDKYNQLLINYRNETYSLCLSSYRESSRKRLTFEEAFYILNCI